jgi:hypothetical protein
MAKKRRKPRPRRPPPADAEGAAQPTAAKPPAPKPRRPIEEERPPAPWGSFPLVELVVLVALVMLVAGLIVQGSQGTVLLSTGLALGALAGLELSIREHFAGYRSHTALLAGAAAVATLALLFYVAPDLVPPPARLVLAAVVGGLAALGLARAFRSRAGRTIKLR